MATFRVGDRARLVNVRNAPNRDFHPCEGDEVTILGLPGSAPGRSADYVISRPAHYAGRNACAYGAEREYLAPLTDPKADEFIARLEKLGREPVGQPMKETVEVRK